MELCYLVSMSVLQEILGPLASAEARYRLVATEHMVTVIHYGPAGLINQFAFPVAYRIPDVPEEEGTLILMVATARSRESNSFWAPVETRLVHSSTNVPA
ncbi:MAG: hypothetical protein ACRD4I_06970 [Candidatus Angelobacter sp.]